MQLDGGVKKPLSLDAARVLRGTRGGDSVPDEEHDDGARDCADEAGAPVDAILG